MQNTRTEHRLQLNYKVILPASLLSLCVNGTQSAPLPDAGQILRETKPAALPAPKDPGNIILPSEKKQPESPVNQGKLQVNWFRFTGNKKIASERLLEQIPLFAQVIGKRVGLSELNNITDAVTRYYRDNGFPVAVSYVPGQEVKNGVVSIVILEGHIDQSLVAGNTLYPSNTLQRYLSEALCQQASSRCTETVVEHRYIQRAIGIASDLPGINEVTAILNPGNTQGTTQIQLNVTESPRITGQVSADNYGNRYTGRKRLAGSLYINNPFRPGDRLTIDITTSGKGMRFGALNYTLPIGYTGWRGGLGYSSMTYDLGAPFNVTDAHGEAQILSLYSHYPVIRSIRQNITAHANYDLKQLQDSVLDSTFEKREHVFSAGVGGNILDNVAGGGFSTFGLSLSHGKLDYSGSAIPAGVPDNTGSFAKINYSLTRDQTIAYTRNTQRISLFGSLRGQIAGDNLDSVEKLSLGGPGGVRAYPNGEAIGDSGTIASLELRYSTTVPIAGTSDVSIGLFRDQGWLKINHNSWEGYTGPSKRRISGNGISISVDKHDTFSVSLHWAARDRGSEEATSDKDSRSRLWLHTRFSF